ncbi:RNA-binding protein 41 [Cyprinodon tularosa]|uniref:RNA-binding protein 41 n=1 Tax=Cyprinodon tularosa TaxID=77115 RepID=UPI0018E2098B|nr:RNA-binding protein 41 [Cyprinodon tularosa]
MRRVSRRACEEGPLLEEQETEGQRQLHSLLLQQLHTAVDIDRCVAKKQCFAPAALYRPFGDQAAGVRSLSQFQALQDGEKELVSLRELGLTDAEIQLWQSRNAPDSGDKPSGVGAAPDAKQQRLQTIRDKMAARAELLSRPQRFSASRPLSRREMEIEQALFHGNERLGFLTALYHRDGNADENQQGASSSDPMDSIYRDVLRCQTQISPEDSSGHQNLESSASSTSGATWDQSERFESSTSQSNEPSGCEPDPQSEDASEQLQKPQDRVETDQPDPPVRIDVNRPIGSLAGASAARSGKPLTACGEIETLTDEEILNNRESEEGIRSIPRFKSYQPGNASKVLCVKNLSAQASIAQLVALFSRFEQKDGPPVVYRLLTGRMKGQAFITLPDCEAAQKALQLVHGYRLLGKPLVVEFGRERQEEEKRKQEGQTEENRKKEGETEEKRKQEGGTEEKRKQEGGTEENRKQEGETEEKRKQEGGTEEKRKQEGGTEENRKQEGETEEKRKQEGETEENRKQGGETEEKRKQEGMTEENRKQEEETEENRKQEGEREN